MDKLDKVIEDLESHVKFLGELVERLENVVKNA
ncbi:hypothetical protein LCGC14_0844350 [marine sediment metagenome]|uniref:Uncharacterized protein n=1 Tax=marine sediment metagenome TaxID=412755 RepID=A0A0F9PXC4_9ZZZZ